MLNYWTIESTQSAKVSNVSGVHFFIYVVLRLVTVTRICASIYIYITRNDEPAWAQLPPSSADDGHILRVYI